jgi:hypothetical protein
VARFSYGGVRKNGQRRAGAFLRSADLGERCVRGWLGVYLDTSGDHKVDWREVSAIVEDAFRHVAPKVLVAGLDSRLSR